MVFWGHRVGKYFVGALLIATLMLSTVLLVDVVTAHSKAVVYRSAMMGLQSQAMEPALKLLRSGTLPPERQNLLAWRTGMALSYAGHPIEASQAWRFLEEQIQPELDLMLRDLIGTHEANYQLLEAAQLLNAWVARAPADWTRHNALGEFFLRQSLHNEAAAAFRLGATATTGATSAFLAGRAAEIDRDWQAAREHYQTAVDQGMPSVLAHYRLAYTLGIRLDDTTVAIPICIQATELEPGNYACYELLGRLYQRVGDVRSAITWLERGLDYVPKASYRSLFGQELGYIYLKQAEPDQARKFFELAVELMISNADAYRGLGMVYAAQGQFEAAIETYQQALYWGEERDQTPSYWYTEIGMLYERQGETMAAVEAYRSALRLNREDVTAAARITALLEGD
jgi:tetratricopeptide (TPR) repeat protein